MVKFVKKKYENYGCVVFSFLVFIIMIVFVLLFLGNKRIILFKSFSGVVFSDNCLVLILNDSQLKLFQKNKTIYIENKKKNFKIKKIEKNILERDGEKYNQVFFEVNFTDLYKVNDVLNVSVMEKNVRSLYIFRIIWGSDFN